MGRWQDDARGRLAMAAFQLFTTQGFEATTGSQIAAAAGMHERSFFRHFPDKRDALFVGWDEVAAQLRADAVACPPDVRAVDVVRAALGKRCDAIADNHAFVRARVALLSANRALHERDLSKHDELSSALTDALGERGVDEAVGRLLPQTAVAAFRDAVASWARDEAPTTSLRTTYEERLRMVAESLV